MSRTTTVRRRIAAGLAALGVLTFSSGLAIIASAGPASAAKTSVNICHATSSDTNPYTFITVDDDSATFKGHLEHRQNPNKKWKDAGTWDGTQHAADQDKPDLIGDFVDDQGVAHTYDGVVTKARCEGAVVSLEATADVDWIEPSCANPNLADYDATGSNVTFALTSGTVAPGNSVEVTATANPGSTFDGGGTTQKFTHTFDPAVDPNLPPCKIVLPPDAEATAGVVFTDADCANPTAADYTTSGDNVTFALTSGTVAPGNSVEVTATANPGSTFDGGGTTQKFTHTFDPAVDPNVPPCKIVLPPGAEATAGVVFTDADCANPTAADYTTSGDNVTFALTSGTVAPGEEVTVTATADANHIFADATTVKEFPHTFADEVDPDSADCVVAPPTTQVVDVPTVNPPAGGSTPTLVHAGLIDELTTVGGLQREQGMALLGGGLALLVVAAGLGLVRPDETSKV